MFKKNFKTALIVVALCSLGVVSQAQNKKDTPVSWDGKNHMKAMKYMKTDKETILVTPQNSYVAGGVENEDGSTSTYIRIDNNISKKFKDDNAFSDKENNEGSEKTVKATPTLFNTYTTFNFRNFGTTQATLYISDNRGEIIFKKDVTNKNQLVFERGNLPTGSYFFNVNDGEKIIDSGKFIIVE